MRAERQNERIARIAIVFVFLHSYNNIFDLHHFIKYFPFVSCSFNGFHVPTTAIKKKWKSRLRTHNAPCWL